MSRPPDPARRASPSGLGALIALTGRELSRFARQPSRIVAGIGTGLLLWLVVGSGFARSFALPGAEGSTYAQHLLPGVMGLVVVFSSVFGAISLIEERHEGFLQSVLVSPAPRWAMVGSKLLGGSILATAQGAVLLPLALVGSEVGRMGVVECALALAVLLCISLGLTGLALGAAWRIDSVQGFHGVMNIVLMPMWLLSGAIFPVQGAAGWLRTAMMANPLTWPMRTLSEVLLNGAGAAGPGLWAATIGFGAGGSLLAWLAMSRGSGNAGAGG